MHFSNDESIVVWISDSYPEDISKFFITEDVDLRGERWNDVDKENDGDIRE